MNTTGNTPTDKVDVNVKHGSSKWVPQVLTVELVDDGVREGNRQTDLATIALQEYGRWMVLLTWDEARELAAALTRITDIAQHG